MHDVTHREGVIGSFVLPKGPTSGMQIPAIKLCKISSVKRRGYIQMMGLTHLEYDDG